MSKICIIAAVEQNNGLGKNNQLAWHLPADLAHFKALTLGKPIIMGRKTHESIGRALPGRHNIVISRTMPATDGISVVRSLNGALLLEPDAPEIMLIGGASIYSEALAITQTIYLTRIHQAIDTDVFFPALDTDDWQLTEKQAHTPDEKNAFRYTFMTYEKN